VFTTVVIVSVIAGSVLSLLQAIRSGDRVLEVISKTAASAAFAALGATRWSAGDPVATWLLAGLVLCAVGDVCLLWDRSFDLGLAVFLLGHLAYVGAFRAAVPMAGWPLLVAAPVALAGIGAASWLWPRLGARRAPVLLYILAISLMVWGALSTLARGALPWTAGVGAVLFYLSDLAVARQRFVHADFLNRGLGLPTYYAAQVLLALTIGSTSPFA
jgi:uncharacterized membrane protein YhhN